MDFYLHIGHGKTGSSYLQKVLVASIDNLEHFGFSFPNYINNFDKIANGYPTTGNFHKLSNLYDFLDSATKEVPAKKVIFSSEDLFYFFLKEDLNKIKEFLILGGHNFKVLMFIRDPIETLISAYGQGIKSGLKIDPIEFIKDFNLVQDVSRVIDKLDFLGCEITIKNYSKCKSSQVNSISNFLGLIEGSLTVENSNTVNRSLTSSEIELLKILNKYIPSLSFNIPNALVRELPLIKGELLYEHVQENIIYDLVEKLNNDIEYANTKIDEPNKYSLLTIGNVKSFFKESELVNLNFNTDQIELIAREMGLRLNQVETKEGNYPKGILTRLISKLIIINKKIKHIA